MLGISDSCQPPAPRQGKNCEAFPCASLSPLFPSRPPSPLFRVRGCRCAEGKTPQCKKCARPKLDSIGVDSPAVCCGVLCGCFAVCFACFCLWSEMGALDFGLCLGTRLGCRQRAPMRSRLWRALRALGCAHAGARRGQIEIRPATCCRQGAQEQECGE